MSETKVIDIHEYKFPIRSMQFSVIPSSMNTGHGSAWTTIIAIKLHVLAEVNGTRFASFVFGCIVNGYSNQFTYNNGNVDCLFSDGSDSYLCIRETHSQIIDRHLLGKDTVKDQYVSQPFLIQIGRNSQFATMCPPAPQANNTSIKESE